MLNALLTFDIEVWCNSWDRLDEEFPAAFERYVYGDRQADSAALPLTLSMLKRHGLRAVFFVEPLFAARFGVQYLREIIELIAQDGHQIEMHLHSEWADEINPRPLPHIPEKRQHLQQLDLADQETLMRLGLSLLHEAGARDVRAFRAGSFGANADTLLAARRLGLEIDSSINAAMPISVPDLRGKAELYLPSTINGMLSVPVSVFRDGFGRLRHAQVGSCSAAEIGELLAAATARQWPVLNILSHNFEMMRVGSARPDPVVVRRFEAMCKLLAEYPNLRRPKGDLFEGIGPVTAPTDVPRLGVRSAMIRYSRQVLRRALPT